MDDNIARILSDDCCAGRARGLLRSGERRWTSMLLFAGEPWTEAEHAAFLAGLRQLGKVGTVSILDCGGLLMPSTDSVATDLASLRAWKPMMPVSVPCLSAVLSQLNWVV